MRRRRLFGKGRDPSLERDEFTEKVLAAEETLYRVALSMSLSQADCEDAVQQAVLTAYRQLSTLRQPQFFTTWLVRILINECHRLHRRRPTVPYEDALGERAAPEQDYSNLYRAIRMLKPKIRVTVVLYYIEGYSVAELQQILKVPQGTVKSRLSKGRAQLKALLEGWEVDR